MGQLLSLLILQLCRLSVSTAATTLPEVGTDAGYVAPANAGLSRDTVIIIASGFGMFVLGLAASSYLTWERMKLRKIGLAKKRLEKRALLEEQVSAEEERAAAAGISLLHTPLVQGNPSSTPGKEQAVR